MSNTKFGCILFTDVKSSSKLWAAHPTKMLEKLEILETKIQNYAKLYKSLIVKTIGDAVMIYFNNKLDAVNCAIKIQLDLKKKPITFSNKDKLQIRIGIADGEISMRVMEIQGHKLKDFFGPSVNISSRMESKVSPVGGFGVLIDNEKSKENREVKKAIESYNFETKKIIFTNSCKRLNFTKRSGRLILPQECILSSVLHLEDNLTHVALSVCV